MPPTGELTLTGTETAKTPAPAPAPTDQSIKLQQPPGLVRVGATLKRLEASFKNALPKHLTPEKFFRVTLTTLTRTPKLLDCSPESLIMALFQCAALGLEPDGLLGHAYLVPFKDQVQFIPGYRGLIKMVRQSGEVAAIYARAVHAKDVFRVVLGLDEKLEHEPYAGADDPGEVVAVYAVARFKGGEAPQFDVMWRRQVDAIRDKSQGFQYADRNRKDSPWHVHYEEMAKKTVLRRLCKMLPQAIERDDLARAVALDEQAEAGIAQTPPDFDIPTITGVLDVKPEDEGKRKPIEGKEG